MAEDRENKLIIVPGKKRIGKSNETLRNIFFDLIPVGRKALFLDINNEYGEYKIYLPDGSTKVVKIKRILHSDIQAFSSQTTIEAARVIPMNDNGTKMTNDQIDLAWVNAMDEFKGGTLVVEDLNKIFGDQLPKSVSGALTNNTHRDSDIYLHIQSIGRVVPKMRQNAEIIRMHFEFNSMMDMEGKLGGETQMFRIAQLIINHQYYPGMALIKKNPTDLQGQRMIRQLVFVNREESKLTGDFTRRMLWVAIMDYLSSNKWEFQPYLDKMDIHGKKVFTHFQAMEKKGIELFNLYWGND